MKVIILSIVSIIALLEVDPELSEHQNLKKHMSMRQGHKAWEKIA